MKKATWIFTKKHGRKYLVVGEFAQTWYEQTGAAGIVTIFDYFAPNGYKAPHGLAKAWKGLKSWEAWNNDKISLEEFLQMFNENELLAVVDALETWAKNRGLLMPYTYIGKMDGVWGVWPDVAASVADGEADVNERGNVTFGEFWAVV